MSHGDGEAIVTALTGAACRGKAHATAAKELRTALAQRNQAASAEKALCQLVSAKGDVEHGTALITAAKTKPLVRRAWTLVELAVEIVRLGR